MSRAQPVLANEKSTVANATLRFASVDRFPTPQAYAIAVGQDISPRKDGCRMFVYKSDERSESVCCPSGWRTVG
jgi:hypothetical protein